MRFFIPSGKIFAAVVLFCSLSGFAQTRICFGTFLNENFAEALAATLADEGVEAEIIQEERYPGSVYLFVVSQEFASEKAAAAEIRKLKADRVIEKAGAGEPRTVVFKDPVFYEFKSAAAVQKNDFPLTEELPYSVFLERYKEESRAENAESRLEAQGIDSYIVKKYDDETLMSFDLHSGAFSSEEEAEAYRRQLTEKGVGAKEVSHLDEFRGAAERFDKLTDEEEIVRFRENYRIPEELPPVLIEQLSYFPLHADYALSSLCLFDINNIAGLVYDFDNEIFRQLSEITEELGRRDVCSLAVYENALFGKTVTVMIFSGENPTEQTFYFEEDSEARLPYKGKYGLLNFYRTDSDTLAGVSGDRKHVIFLNAGPFSDEEWEDFISRSWYDSDRFIYPEIRETLFILPKTGDSDRRFLAFELSRVGQSYAEERGNVLWSRRIVGHWSSAIVFDCRNALTSVSFFNLDYDLNARKTHGLFMKMHREDVAGWYWNISEEKSVNGVTGWFLEANDKNELSFSFGPYIVAVGSTRLENALFDYNEILKLALDLQIWEIEYENQ